MKDFSRRTLAKGAAWTVPTVGIMTAAPAIAASTCTPQAKAAIDTAFKDVQTTLVAYWTLDTVSQLDGMGGARPYLNIINNTKYDLVTATTPLSITLNAYFADATKPQWSASGVFTSYGTLSPRTNVTYANRPAQRWTWNAGGGTVIYGNGAGKDNVADMVFTSPGSLTHSPPGTIVCATLNSVPTIKPSFAAIQPAYPSLVGQHCLDYYNAKSAVAPAFSFSGPRLSGTTPWNNNGRTATLPGGSTAWAVGATVCSDTVGNYISDANPPRIGGAAYGYNGIF